MAVGKSTSRAPASTALTEPELGNGREVAPAELDRETRGIIGEMVATANRYPRTIKRFVDEAIQLVTLDEETAAACMYALPRDGKTIEGPSARFAEIVATCWRNLRVDARVVEDTGSMITARGTAWDMERNVLIAYEVSRRVVDKRGRRYSEDMVVVTGNAASSIALRNAVLKVIPAAIWRPLYLKAREVAVGNSETLSARRTKMLEYFGKLGAPRDRVFALLGVRGEEDITLEHLATLRGLATAIREGDTTLDEAFAGVEGGIAPPKRASDTTGTGTGTGPSAPETPSAAAPPADQGEPASTSAEAPQPPAAVEETPAPLTVAQITAHRNADQTRVWWSFGLSDGRKLWTSSSAIAQDAADAKDLGSRVLEVATVPEHVWHGHQYCARLVIERQPGQEG